MLQTFLRDMKFGGRALRRRPGFFAVAAATLALGIGATTCIFSVVHAVLLNPLPYPRADRIAVLWQHRAGSPERDLVAPGNFLDWKRQAGPIFEHLAAISPWGLEYVGTGDPESVSAALVTRGFFEALGARFFLGRSLGADDFRNANEGFRGSGADALILTYEYWLRRFGADSSIVGRVVTFSARPYAIVGVLAPGFRSPIYPGRDAYGALLWWPSADEDRRSTFIGVVGRLKDAVTMPQATATLRTVAARLSADHPRDNAGVEIAYVPVREQVVGRVQRALFILLGAVSFILLIACANIANLLLARAAERRGEFAVRTALGATRSRLVRQLLTESLALATAGCIAGGLLAYWGIRAVQLLAPRNVPRLEDASLNVAVGLFAAAVTVLTALLIGLVPAWHAARSTVSQTLRESAATKGSSGHQRARGVFMVAQVAMAMVLLLGAGLLVRSFQHVLSRSLGFDPARLLTLQVYAYTRNPTAESRAEYFRRAVAAVREVPGIVSATVAQAPPLVPGGGDHALPVLVEGEAEVGGVTPRTAWDNVAGPDYARVMGIPLRAGRDIASTDIANSVPVAVVNEAMARRFWPGQRAVGKRFTVAVGSTRPTLEVIGVIGDVRQLGLEDEPRPQFFRPHTQNATGGMVFLVRTKGAPARSLDAIRRAIWTANPAQPFYAVATMEELLGRTLAQRRFAMLLLGAFSALAAVLAALGTYSVISYLVTQRRQEIGIRVAMGARPAQILWSVVHSGLRWVATGVVIGVTGALTLSRLLRALLYEVSPADPLTVAATAGLLLLMAVAASYIGARRATRVDPVVALRGG